MPVWNFDTFFFKLRQNLLKLLQLAIGKRPVLFAGGEVAPDALNYNVWQLTNSFDCPSGVISQDIYVVIVTMSILTTVFAPLDLTTPRPTAGLPL